MILNSIMCQLPLSELYDKVEWPEESERKSMLRLVKEPPPEWITVPMG